MANHHVMVPLRGGPSEASKAEVALWRAAQNDNALLSIKLQAGDTAVYADRLKLMSWWGMAPSQAKCRHPN